MKLDIAQVERIRAEVGIWPIPEPKLSYGHLEDNYGERPFYLDPMGLYVWEASDDSEVGRKEIMALQIASWVDENMTALEVHTPRATGKVVVVEAHH